MAQYAALAAKSSCLAALVRRDIAALKSSVKTINTPTALNVSLLLALAILKELDELPLVAADEVELSVASDSVCVAVLVS